MSDISLVTVDVNGLIRDFAKRIKNSRRLTLAVFVGAAYLVVKQATIIQTLTKENEELKTIKEE